MKDVVIVGGGPAGLHAASRLAAWGLDVVVLEAQSRIGARAICSGVIGEEAFARFDLPTRAVLTNIHCIQAISPAGSKLEHRATSRLARVVNKGEFNRAMGERAVAAGAEIRLGQRVETIEREKHGVCLSFRSPGDGRQSVRARVVIIASGVDYSFNRSLGLAMPREFLPAVQADVELPSNGNPTPPTKVYVGREVAPGAFGWQIPLGKGSVRVGVMSTHNPRPYFMALLRRIAPELDGSRVKICQKGIAQAPVGRCVTDRIVAVGECAGHVKTSTGGGIYYGLMSAEFLAQVVVRAFRKGHFTADAFGDFERYWRTAFGSELLVGYFARKLASSFTDNQIERIFASANASDFLGRLNGRLKFDWHRGAFLAALRSLVRLPGGAGGN